MKKALFVINRSKPDAPQIAIRAAQLLQKDGICCCLSQDEPLTEKEADCFELLAQEQALALCDCIITVGGDGTILHTVAKFGESIRPLLGINVGRMGFLATVEPAELEQLHRLAKGDYFIEDRTLLCAYSESAPQQRFYALNDIVIAKREMQDTIHCTVHCDGTPVSSYQGDGVIIATPTGSTAYSLSAGGPIVDAKSNCILVTPICAHSLNTPTMVFAANRELKIAIDESRGGNVSFSADGTNNLSLAFGENVYVHQSSRKIQLITFCEADQLKTIDTKLKGR